MPRRGLALWMVAQGACALDATAYLDSEGANSAIVVYQTPGAGARLTAIDLGVGASALELEVADGAVARASLYTLTLAELGLSPGPIMEPIGDWPRPLPPSERLYQALLDSSTTHWAPLDDADGLDGVQLRSLAESCLRLGGCAEDGEQGPVCKLPCPTPSPLFEPEPPALPVLTPCPSGWTEQAASGSSAPASCDAPRASAAPCADGWVRFSDSADCERIGVSCPAPGSFQTGLPPGTIYVRAGAVAGDGSLGAPFGSLADGLAAATAGATVALAAGEYREVHHIDKRVQIVGACVEGTVLSNPAPAADPSVAVVAAGVLLRDLSVRGGLVGLSSPSRLQLRSVRVEADGIAWRSALGGVARGERVVVRGGEIGILIMEGSVCTLDRVLIERTMGGVLVNDPGSTLRASRLAVRDLALPVPGDLVSFALRATTDAAITLQDSVLEGHAFSALSVQDNAQLSASRIQIRADAAGGPTIGIQVSNGARLLLEQSLFEDMVSEGVNCALCASAQISDLWVRRPGGTAIALSHLARADLSRVLVTDFTSNQVTVRNREEDHCVVHARDITVDRDQGTTIQQAADYAVDLEGLSVTLERALIRIHGSHKGLEIGPLSGTVTASASVSDVRIEGGALGMNANSEGDVAVDRLVAVDGLTTGLRAENDARVVARHVRIEGSVGACAAIAASAHLTLSRFRLDQDPLCGARVTIATEGMGNPGELDLSDGVISGSDVGVQVGVPNYDLLRLTSGVSYSGNDLNFAPQ